MIWIDMSIIFGLMVEVSNGPLNLRSLNYLHAQLALLRQPGRETEFGEPPTTSFGAAVEPIWIFTASWQKARTLSEVKLEHLEPTWFSDTWTHFEHFEHFKHWHPMKQTNNSQAAPTKFWPSYVLNRHLLTWPHGIHQLSIAGALPPVRNALEDEAPV